jgi:hypothetical protein
LLLKLDQKELKKVEITKLEVDLARPENSNDSKKFKIINTWILVELEKLEEDYFKHSKRLETSFLVKELIDFT